MLNRADDLAKMTVQDASGADVVVGSFWRTRTAALVFLRHFGCILCRDHVVQLHRHNDELRAAGIELIIIGNGSPSFIEGFRDQTKWEGPIYTDPSLAVYQVAQLKRSVIRSFDPRSLGSLIKASARGQRRGATQGDPWQQGGVVVVSPSGEVLWQHASDRPGDNASAAQIIAAAR